ncbi:hypothetical protein GCM10027169_00270 [Gordonia jinhuaensis]|uniref:Colicin import membrane protein n=1 Tax=Gordonia jinhuaensis TaxID=1517702 RepID=A0A916SU88_9ACTN|nr:hypothetical protein [Gordonia jinhuaensis]GGB18277.1 hypothetical protein GCM10011489_02930 [Gordonia jinhuaensis]
MAQEELDVERSAQMRTLLATEGEQAVAQRFGEDALQSREFEHAQRQRRAALARERAQVERGVADAERARNEDRARSERAEAVRREQAEGQRRTQAAETGPASAGRTGAESAGDLRQQRARERVEASRQRVHAANKAQDRRKEQAQRQGAGQKM